MSILIKFEDLSKQAIFASNKDDLLQSIGLIDIIKSENNKKIRTLLSQGSEQFADMSRVVR